MKVRIKKVHDSWNAIHTGEFTVGDIVELENNIVTTKSGKRFSGKDLAKSYGCAYPDIFEKVS